MSSVRVRRSLPQPKVLYVWRKVTANARRSATMDDARVPADTIDDADLDRISWRQLFEDVHLRRRQTEHQGKKAR